VRVAATYTSDGVRKQSAFVAVKIQIRAPASRPKQ
jgi:hypothetical protein